MKLCAIALLLLLPAAAALNNVDKNKTVGNPAAPVVIQIYSDFECPVCKVFHEQTLPQLMMDYVNTGKVYLVFREFPLNIHKYSRLAANIATAAAQLGFYQPVADALFRDQAVWSANGKVWDSAASVLNPAQQKKVRPLVDDASVFGTVQRDMEAGNAVPITSTPTLVVSRGDKRYPVGGTLHYSLLKRLIDDLSK